MKLSHLPLSMCLAAFSLPFAPTFGAQPTVATTTTIAPAKQTVPGPDRIIKFLDINAPTSTGEVVEFIRKETDANILLKPGTEKTAIPPLKLRDVTVIAALEALSEMVDPKTPISISFEGKDPNVMVVSIPQIDRSSLDIVTRAFLLPSQPDQDFDKQLYMVNDAVNAAVNLDAKARNTDASTHQPLLMETHKATHLLLVSGERADVEIAAQVVSLLQGEAVAVAKSKSSPPEPIKVTVLGQVQAPGVYTVDAGTNLAQAIAKAQGLTRLAGKTKKISIESKSGARVIVDFSTVANSYLLQDGDRVTVPETE